MSIAPNLAHAIRFLSIDAVEKAQCGHPGMPLGMADIATVLWQKFLQHSPQNPLWFNRDRFILSNGHGSMLLYSLLHLTGYDLSIEEIKNFRQLHSKTPGHPEYGDTPGVETTTGPLGQGLANGVGMALAEQLLAAEFNRPDLPLVDHYTYVFAGDGCLMEGISHEACSLAGTLGLGKLIVFYDDNGISIDGDVTGWFTDDTATRFRAYNWQVITIDGKDYAAIEQAINQARAELKQPTLIICKTIIGYGSKQAGSEKTHGAALGAADIQQIREFFNWPYPPFNIPAEIYAAWDHRAQGTSSENAWLLLCSRYQQTYPQEYHEFLRRIHGDLPDDWQQYSDQFIVQCLEQKGDLATRKTSQMCLEHYCAKLPELFGGSADLTHSNNTNWSGTKVINHGELHGNYLHYGVREFAMAAMMTGMSLHGGFIPYGGTFLVFADYARNALRLSALMHRRVVYVLSHDSVGLGEDGPTHQPIEHASMLRMTPNLQVWRPADLVETAIAWQQAISSHFCPTALLLSRQNLPSLPHTATQIADMQKGGYIIQDCAGEPGVILLATGSEVHIAIQAAQQLAEEKINVRVISLPCAQLFLAQDRAYQDKILPPNLRKRVAIEAAATAYWYRFVGLDGAVIGIDRFGVSAPGKEALKELGITVEHTVAEVKKLLF